MCNLPKIIGYVPKDTYKFCEVDSEMVHHLFYECPFTNLFFRNLKTFALHSQMSMKSFCNEACSWRS